MSKGNSSTSQRYIEVWDSLLNETRYSNWVVFSNGTVVLVVENQENIEAFASSHLKEWGRVIPGTPLGDIGILEPAAVEGWVVYGASDFILCYVAPEELRNKAATDINIGLLGRNKRNRDAKQCRIIHVHSKR